eukprot:SAG31_NODE_10996_length_1075_cov_0.922131_2_plen_90_part_00
MMINLPTSTQNEATLAMAERNYRHGKLNAQGLHTHYNQDGYGDGELICYAILPIFDMNRETGATAIVRECNADCLWCSCATATHERVIY